MNQLVKKLYLTMNRINQTVPGTHSPPPPQDLDFPSTVLVDCWKLRGREEGVRDGSRGQRQMRRGDGWSDRTLQPQTEMKDRIHVPLSDRKKRTVRRSLSRVSNRSLPCLLFKRRKIMETAIFLMQSYCYRDKNKRACYSQ